MSRIGRSVSKPTNPLAGRELSLQFARWSQRFGHIRKRFHARFRLIRHSPRQERVLSASRPFFRRPARIGLAAAVAAGACLAPLSAAVIPLGFDKQEAGGPGAGCPTPRRSTR